MHFSHANGYPPQTYRKLLQEFEDQHAIIVSEHRPLWRPEIAPESLNSWQVFADDLEVALEAQEKPVISVGHSMGSAAVMMAAARRPELFKAIVLIEPVLVPRRFVLLLKIFRTLAKHKIPMVGKALNRVDCWADKTSAFNHFRPKPVFKEISDEILWDFVNHGLEDKFLSGDSEAKSEVTLRYSKQWEAHCYSLVHNLWPLLPKLKVPVLAIRGETSNTLWPATWQRWQKMSPQHDYLEIKGAGHLVPFEQPHELAKGIKAWLEQLKDNS